MNTERKLVTIRTIDDLKPIEGADLIELAIIGGWQGIVKKNSFKVGELCVYFEIDSFLPIHPRYEFLRKNCYRNINGLGEGFRIKSIKLKGEVSQGLILPLGDFDFYQESEMTWKYTDESGNQHYINSYDCNDLSEMFGVIKYDPPVPECLAGKARGNFPSFIPKTDEERLQNLGRYFEKEIQDQVFEISEKLDGSSMTCFFNNGDLGVCSRNMNLTLDQEGNSFVDYAKESKLLEALEKFKMNIAVQGELVSPSIQGGRYNVPRTLYVYNIFNIDTQKYLSSLERLKVLSNLIWLGATIKHVPILDSYKAIKENDTIKSLIEFADGPSTVNPNTLREGLVYKRDDGNFSFKTISNKWLLKTEG